MASLNGKNLIMGPNRDGSISIQTNDSASIDAFGRFRVSTPQTLFDSKNLYTATENIGLSSENQPLFWDNKELSGSGTSTTYNENQSSQTLAVSNATLGIRARQTKMRFNYQPGKAIGVNEPVLTIHGFKEIGSLKIGDEIFDGLGNITRIVGIADWSNRAIYRVTLDDGQYVDVDIDHDWTTIERIGKNKGQRRIVSTREMLNRYDPEVKFSAYRYRIPKSPVLDIEERDVPVDAYTLGCILGDGIKELSLNGKTFINKSVPELYKFNYQPVRLAILQGLMDTDGYVDKRTGDCEFNSSSKQLAEDVAYLVRSLGGQAKIKIKKSGYNNLDGDFIKCNNNSYRVRVISSVNPFRLKRKADLWKPRTRVSFDRYIHKIEYIGNGNTRCIEVASSDHNFLTRGNIVTHNSQLVFLTFNMDGNDSGIIKREGLFDANNGLFLELDGTNAKFVQRSNTSGSPVDNSATQSNWSEDRMDGSGPSGITLDFTKTQILVIDFEWLGVGRVRMGFVIDGIIYYCHNFHNANINDTVYMSTPNLPIRSEIINGGSGGASTLTQICASIMSEGGSEDLGQIRTALNATNNPIDLTTENITYAILGLRLKSSHLGATIKLLNTALQLITPSNQIQWTIRLNPTITGTFTYSDNSYSAVQIGRPTSSPTVTGGIIIAGGFLASGGVSSGSYGNTDTGIDSAIRLGSTIDGTRDTIVLCATPRTGSAGADVFGSLTWREIL